MMLKVILYGFTEGIFSSRKLARSCEESLPFLYLSGLQTPVYRTFIEFRDRHREGMETVFKETVLLARTMGLAKLGNVALDGTKVLSNTSKHKAMSYGRMQEEEDHLRKQCQGRYSRRTTRWGRKRGQSPTGATTSVGRNSPSQSFGIGGRLSDESAVRSPQALAWEAQRPVGVRSLPKYSKDLPRIRGNSRLDARR